MSEPLSIADQDRLIWAFLPEDAACTHNMIPAFREVERIRDNAAAAARAEVVEAVEALASEWEQEAAERGPDDQLYTGGVAARLRTALAPPVDHVHAADGTEVGT